MNRFLLLALTAGLLSPIAAKAETDYLLINNTHPSPWAHSIPMESVEQCEEQIKAINKWRDDEKYGRPIMICIKGK